MYSRSIVIQNNTGLHARPAAIFAQMAMNYKSIIIVKKEEKSANAKSILALMTLGISKGTEITIEADGEDEVTAVDSLTALINTKFGEA